MSQSPASPAAGQSAVPNAAETEQSGATRLVIGSIAILLLLASLDQTIVSTALPTIVADLGGLEHLSWVVTAYILASTIVAPLYGKFGDLYGRRNTVFVSVGLFLLGSVLCGMATSMTFLILARGLQGLGGGGLFVLALSIIGEVIPMHERGKVQGIFAGVFSVSSVIGPLIGGWFVQAFSWHWIFYINLPLGALALAIFAASFRPTGRRVAHKIDYAGALALSLTLGSMVLVTSLGGRTFAWSSPEILGLIVLGTLSLGAFLWIETRAEEPILPLSLFGMNVFLVTSAVGFVAGASLFGGLTFLPIYLQIVKGATPTASGLLLVPMTLGILAGSTVSGRTLRRGGKARLLLGCGTGFLALGLVLLSTITRDTSLVIFCATIMLVGLGLGCIFPVVTTSVQNAVPRQMIGTATAAGLMFRQVGGSIAVALFGAMFAARVSAGLGGESGIHAAEIGPQMLAHIPPEARETLVGVVVAALHPIYWIAAGLALAGFVVATRLDDRAQEA